MAALPVDPKICVIKSFDQVIPAPVTIGAPWLHGKWLVEVVIVSILFVVGRDYAFDNIRGC